MTANILKVLHRHSDYSRWLTVRKTRQYSGNNSYLPGVTDVAHKWHHAPLSI